MLKRIPIVLVALFALSLPIWGQSERITDVGAIVEAKASAAMGDTELEVEEELRFASYDGFHLDRWLTSLTLERPVPFPWLGKRLHVGIHADYVRHYDDHHYYDNRWRTGLFASYYENVRRFKFSYRTRVMLTYRDERTGDYRVNPKWCWRNKLQAVYQRPNSRFKYTLSTECFMRLRAQARESFIDQWRTTFAVNYRLTRQQSISVFARMDNDLQVKKPFDTFYLGLSYNHSF
jgi:hypothetical protein